MGKLDPFGEAASMDKGSKRTAGILCLEDSELMSLDRDHFQMLVSEEVIPTQTFVKLKNLHRKYSQANVSKAVAQVSASQAMATARKTSEAGEEDGTTKVAGNAAEVTQSIAASKGKRSWKEVKLALKVSELRKEER